MYGYENLHITMRTIPGPLRSSSVPPLTGSHWTSTRAVTQREGVLPFDVLLSFIHSIPSIFIPYLLRYDYLEFTPEGEEKVKCDGEVGQSRWPSFLEFKGQRLQFTFYSDGSNNEWGYKFTVSLGRTGGVVCYVGVWSIEK